MTSRRRGSSAHRSLWHLVPELATVLHAAGLRPADLPALAGLRPADLPALAGLVTPARTRLSLAGVGLWAARRAGEETVLVDAEGALTGTELGDLVAERAAELRGAGAVLVRGTDDRHLVAALLGAGVAGVDAVLLGARAGDHALARARTRVAALAADRRRREDNRSVQPARRRAPVVVLHSSGTTGRPHPRTQGGVGAAQLPTVVSLAAALRARRGEPMVIAAPLAHGHGLSALAAAFALGAPVLLGAPGRDDRGLAMMDQHQARTWVGLPTQLADLLAAATQRTAATGALARLRRIVTGSAPVPHELVAQVRQVAGDVLVSYYGTTETGTATIARPADLAADPATAGRPATGVSVQVRDRAGRLAPIGEVGQVVLRSPWRAPGEREWVPTSDLGHLDTAGRLVLLGRSDDAVLVGGHVVSVTAVTTWLQDRPGVQRVQVRPVAHERLGHVLEARVLSTGSLADLHAEVRTALGDAAAPRRLLPW